VPEKFSGEDRWPGFRVHLEYGEAENLLTVFLLSLIRNGAPFGAAAFITAWGYGSIIPHHHFQKMREFSWKNH